MSNDIIALVANTPEPEQSGSRTQRKYDFQNHWAICHLLELYQEGIDFILAVECHDDVLEIRPQSPSPLRFFQVKAEKEPLKISATSKTKAMKYLGKLLCHISDFGEDNVALLTLVSEKDFNALLKDDKYAWGRREFSLEDFQDTHQHEIWDAAKALFADKIKDLKFNPRILSFKVTDISEDSFEDTTRGKIISFLEKHGKEKAATPFYKALVAEIRKQASGKRNSLSKDEFIEKRAMSKKDFDNMVKTVVETPLIEESIKKIENYFAAQGVSWGVQRDYKKAIREVETDRYSKNSYAMLLDEKVNSVYQNADLKSGNFIETVDCIYESISNDKLVLKILREKSEMYIKAIIALRLAE